MSYVLLNVSCALLAGLLMTRLFSKLKLPDVTAYLIAGVIIGPYCLGALRVPGVGFDSMEAVEMLSLISKVALGFIAFSIGNEFRLRYQKNRKAGIFHWYCTGNCCNHLCGSGAGDHSSDDAG